MIWKWFFIPSKIKLIFTRKVLHLAWFWKWEFLELGDGIFDITFITWTRYYWANSSLIGMSNTGLSPAHRSRVWTCSIALLKSSCSTQFWARTKLAPRAVTSINFASKERIFPWVVCHHRYHHISNIITRIIIIIIITNIIYYYNPVTFRVRRQILKLKPVRSRWTVAQSLAHKPVSFVSLTDCFISIIFKINEILTLNANTANIKKLSGPEKLPGLSRNGPLVGHTYVVGGGVGVNHRLGCLNLALLKSATV